MENTQVVSMSNLENVLNEIENAFFDIPFGNTNYQCENFVIAGSITPTRAYRTIGLQLHSTLTSLREIKYQQKLNQIKILELQSEIADPTTNKFERMRKELELEKISQSELWNKKLVSDSIQELNLYYSHFKKLPKFTREEFEREEEMYFQQTQNRQLLGITGAKEAIMNMIDDRKSIEQFEKAFAELPDAEKHLRLQETIKQSMASLIEWKGTE